MIKKLSSKVLLIILILMLVLSFFVLNNVSNSMAEDIAIEIEGDAELKDIYMFGEVLNIPSSKLIYDGHEYNAVPILHLPNGQVISKQKVDLLQAGFHTLRYVALLPSGREISKSFDFIVKSQLYSVGSERSSLSYGNPQVYATDQEGILLSLANGDTFTFNKVIDLSGKTINDNILRLFVIPHNIGIADASNIHVRFTDIYDPLNYVTVTTKDGGQLGDWGIGGVYMVANSREQYPTGLEGDRIHINNSYGMGARFPMAGIPKSTNVEIGDQYLEISWDYDERKVYGSKFRLAESNLLIADLDDTSYMTAPWRGFTTGEVIMTVYASGYQASTMNMVITNINGENIEENGFFDTQPPDISVDTNPYGSDIEPFEAVVGKPFKVFEASANDKYDKEIDVKSTVYYNYGNAEETVCSISNGCFTPSSPGLYTIVYTATNWFTQSTKEIEVNAVNKPTELSIFLNGETQNGYSGQKINLVSRLDVLNNTGMVNLRIIATLRSNPKIKYEINLLDYSFTPYYAGIYDIKYYYSDYLKEKTYSRTLTVAPGNKPVFDVLPILPRYLIKGNKYVLPDAVAYDMSGGSPSLIEYSISVLEDQSAQPKAITNGIYIVNATESAEIIYTASNGINTVTYSETLPVIDTGFGGVLDMKEYFQVVNGSFEKECFDNYVLLSTSQDLSRFIFINPVQVFNFNFHFNPDVSKNNYNTITIYLTDSIDPNICLKMTYIKKTTDISGFKLNDDDYIYDVKSDFFGQSKGFFSLSYNNEKLKLNPSVALSMDVKYDLNGNIFTGFPSNKVFLEIELSGVSGDSAFKVIKINNQTFSRTIENSVDKTDDGIPPEIIVKASLGDCKIGDTVTINPAYAFDVLNSYVTLKLYVTAPDGSFVSNKDGLLMDGSVDPSASHSFVVTSKGQYLVSYEVTDGNGNTDDFSYFINSIDTQPPVITLKDIKTTGNVDTVVKIASATASDNSDLDILVFTFVECPDGKIIYVDNGEFTPELKGIYKVNYITGRSYIDGDRTIYLPGDDFGNIGYTQYTIIIS